MHTHKCQVNRCVPEATSDTGEPGCSTGCWREPQPQRAHVGLEHLQSCLPSRKPQCPELPYLLPLSKCMVSRRHFIFSRLSIFSIRQVTHKYIFFVRVLDLLSGACPRWCSRIKVHFRLLHGCIKHNWITFIYHSALTILPFYHFNSILCIKDQPWSVNIDTNLLQLGLPR